ncbi:MULTISPECIES: SpoIIIAH-like family protein [unclassified Bacillus (in: firmicutes)]|uniref:SpoIIIAH-like family protein n=1 Tax=unclassified Bacillus (in: firmicutes) TaxID=185979 RepID=UPI00080AD1EF|nr:MULTISPECIES: SpoIIIAH-like family protein [unclassified Bacillus (in: firmicutes)]OCA86340.1 stage III sporulation protein AH [Bacillus sp. FJAT-27986]
MLLRKQTVWLLTMLSLVAVLSVYYITTPQDTAVNQEQDTQTTKEKTNTNSSKDSTENEESSTVITNESSDSIFEAMRIDLNDERSRQKEELTNKVASSDLSEEERVEAHAQIEALAEMSTKEDMLETMIIALGYKDALVRADGDQIQITVKADKQDAGAANEIIQMVTKEIGKTNAVAVEFQPEK